MKRVQTGIDGFDKLIEGGFPANSDNIICGSPGTGKTIFALEYIYNGALKFNEPGVFISIEQSDTDLIEQSERFGFKIKEMMNKNMISIVYMPLKKINRDFVEQINKEVKRIKAKRLVVDSLSLLTLDPVFFENNRFSLVSKGKVNVSTSISQFIYNFIHLLEEHQVTTLYVTGSKMDSYETTDQLSEFICDGMIVLRARSMGKILMRTLEIIKMRKTCVAGGINVMEITQQGIEVGKNEKS